MATAENTELIDHFEEFYREYYREEIGELAQKDPSDMKSLFVNWQDLYQFDSDLADDFRSQPEQVQEYAEEALRLYDLPVEAKLGQAHVRITNLPDSTDIRDIRADHRGALISVQGIVHEATEPRSKVTTAAFECQRCGTLTRLPQSTWDFQEPHKCQGCEQKSPFRLNHDQSEFIDAQKLRIQESHDALSGGGTPQFIDVYIEDDITGKVTAGDYATVTGIVKLEQQESDRDKQPLFETHLHGIAIEQSDEPSDNATTDTSNTLRSREQYVNNASRAVNGIPDSSREEETKAKLITPFLQALGWDKYDNNEFRMEYTDGKTAKRPDYALFAPDSETPDIVVEAKSFATDLHSVESEIYTYLKIFDASWGLLSNGQEHWIYQNTTDDPYQVAKIRIEDIAEADILERLSKGAFV